MPSLNLFLSTPFILERFLRIPMAQDGHTRPLTYTSEILDDSNKAFLAAANRTSGRASALSSFAMIKDEQIDKVARSSKNDRIFMISLISQVLALCKPLVMEMIYYYNTGHASFGFCLQDIYSTPTNRISKLSVLPRIIFFDKKTGW